MPQGRMPSSPGCSPCIHHEATALCVTAERDFLRAQGGGCHNAIAARAILVDGKLIPQDVSAISETGHLLSCRCGAGRSRSLTLKGRACLERAEVILYDYLCNPALLRWAREARKLYVGKKAGAHSLSQDQINELLVEKTEITKQRSLCS